MKATITTKHHENSGQQFRIVEVKITWRVNAEPAGRYRAFERRGWPVAFYGNADGPVCARIECDDEYVPSRVRNGAHAPLRIYLADYHYRERPRLARRTHHGAFMWRKLMRTAATLDEAKALVAECVATVAADFHPDAKIT